MYLPRTSLSEVDTSPQRRHRWRCRLIPSVLGAPRGDFFTFPAQNLAYGMRYNARDCGVQLTVNLISRLEEEGPTRLYACQSGFEPTTKRFESRALVSSATREALLGKGFQLLMIWGSIL